MRQHRIPPIRAADTTEPDNCPEKRLLAAFLNRAYRDINQVSEDDLNSDRTISIMAFRTGRDKSEFLPQNSIEHHAQAAIEWVEDRSEEPGGYLWVCLALDLPPLTVSDIRELRGK